MYKIKVYCNRGSCPTEQGDVLYFIYMSKRKPSVKFGPVHTAVSFCNDNIQPGQNTTIYLSNLQTFTIAEESK